MYVANDSDDDIYYSADDPHDPPLLRANCFKMDSSIEKGKVVRFEREGAEMCTSEKLSSSNVLVIYRSNGNISIVEEQSE
jgi:hypothetical protein